MSNAPLNPFGIPTPGVNGNNGQQKREMTYTEQIDLYYKEHAHCPVCGSPVVNVEGEYRKQLEEAVKRSALTLQGTQRVTFKDNNLVRCPDSTGRGCDWRGFVHSLIPLGFMYPKRDSIWTLGDPESVLIGVAKQYRVLGNFHMIATGEPHVLFAEVGDGKRLQATSVEDWDIRVRKALGA